MNAISKGIYSLYLLDIALVNSSELAIAIKLSKVPGFWRRGAQR